MIQKDIGEEETTSFTKNLAVKQAEIALLSC